VTTIQRPSLLFVACFGIMAATLCVPVASAQSDRTTPRFELGGQVEWLHLKEFSLVLPRRTELALGGRFTLNLTDYVAVESQIDIYPRDEFFPGRSKTQAVFGMKAGIRGRRAGLFGKFRPGLVYLRSPLVCLIPEGCGSAPASIDADSWFALDVGVVVETYPSHRLMTRFDVGDTLVRRFSYTDGSGNHFSFSSHNLQLTIGMGIRF
jgi:hypothetical protein